EIPRYLLLVFARNGASQHVFQMCAGLWALDLYKSIVTHEPVSRRAAVRDGRVIDETDLFDYAVAVQFVIQPGLRFEFCTSLHVLRLEALERLPGETFNDKLGLVVLAACSPSALDPGENIRDARGGDFSNAQCLPFRRTLFDDMNGHHSGLLIASSFAFA